MKEINLKTGLKALSQKQYQHVHGQCIEAIKQNTKNATAYFLLGVIAYDHQNFTKAEELFIKSEKFDTTNPHFPAFLGRMKSEQRLPEPAKAAADRASACNIHDGYIADILGVIYSRTGFHELARDCFETAITLDPAQSNFHYNLGASELFLGNFPSARNAFQRATKRDPNHFGAWASLIALDKQTSQAHHLEHLQALYTKLTSDENATHQLGHAIAKTLEDLGQYEESLDWLHKAKSIKHKKYGYDRVASQKTFAAAKATTAIQSHGYIDDTRPIFVMGIPRTGTTLVERILSSHSRVASAGELNFFADLIKSETGTPSNLVLDADTLTACQNIDLAKIGKAYLARVENRLGPQDYFVDKMPFNFFYAALIIQALPSARLIVLRRGAMDSCLSNYRQLLSTQESFYDYTFDLEDIAFFFRQFDRLISHYRAQLPQHQFTEVGYETIVFEQEHQTRKILNFCDLDFEEACLRFHENETPVSTASSVQVRQPLYSRSIGRWKNYGDKLDGLRQALGELAN